MGFWLLRLSHPIPTRVDLLLECLPLAFYPWIKADSLFPYLL